MTTKMTYAGVGVDYDAMDPFKRMAQMAARETAGNILRFGLNENEPSRGESAYLVEAADGYLAHVEEGLGDLITTQWPRIQWP
jgi:phosphoribosylformylglycinamidine cyclo-ligase